MVRRAPLGSQQGRRYFNLHGREGVGKTTLASEIRARWDNAPAVAPVLTPFEDIRNTYLLPDLARLRNRLSDAAPDLTFPRFDNAYSWAIAKLFAPDFKPQVWKVGPIEPREMIHRSLDKGSAKTFEALATQFAPFIGSLGGGAAGVAATAGASLLSVAMAAAFAAGGGIAGYLTLLIAKHYERGARQKAREDVLLKASAPYQALLNLENNVRMRDVREALPQLLAEDINHSLASAPPQARPLIALLVDPADPFADETDFEAEPYAEVMQVLLRHLAQGYVIALSRERPTHWEERIANALGPTALNTLYDLRYEPLLGLSAEEVMKVFDQYQGDLGLDAEGVKAAVAQLPRYPDRITIPPATVKTYWNARLNR